MSCAESARLKVLGMSDELLKESQRIGIMRSVDATETARWLKEVSEALRDTCVSVDPPETSLCLQCDNPESHPRHNPHHVATVEAPGLAHEFEPYPTKHE